MCFRRTIHVWIAVVFLLTVLSASSHAASARSALESRFERALAAQRWASAASIADSLVRRRERDERLAPTAAATLLDSLGLRLFRGANAEAWTAAEPLFRAGLARREQATGSESVEVAANLVTLSTLLDYLGRWQEAVPLASRAAALRTRLLGDHHAATAASLRQLGMLHFQLGELARAEEPLRRSLAIYEGLLDASPARLVDAHNNLGELLRVRDEFAEAELHFRRALEIARTRLAEDDPRRQMVENNLAGLLKDLGRLGEAEPLLERGLASLESGAGDPTALATARLNLAEVQRLQGRSSEAAPGYRRALNEARAALGADHPDLVLFLNQRAVCEQDLGHVSLADSLYGESGRIVERTLGGDHPLMAQNLADRARLRLVAGRAQDADSMLARALAIRERVLGPRHPDVALLLVDQARVRGDGESGRAALERAIAILDSGRTYPEARLDAYALRAERSALHDDRAAALRDMRIALDEMDALRSHRGGGDDTRAAFVAGRLGLVERMVCWQLESGDVAGALETQERARARVLLDHIATGGVDLRAGIAPRVLQPLAAAERAAEERLAAAHRAMQAVSQDLSLAPRERLAPLAALTSRRDSAARELALARRRIEDVSPLWRGVLSAEGQVADLAAIQRAVVPRNGILLVYQVGSRESHVFAVPPRGRVEAFPLMLEAGDARVLGVARASLTDSTLERILLGAVGVGATPDAIGVSTLLAGVSGPGFLALPLRTAQGPDEFELRLHALWRTLVPPPLRRRVLAASEAVVIPDGALHQLAFEALVTRPRGRGHAQTHYWLDDGPAVAYGPSATSLLTLARRSHAAAAGAVEVLSVSDVTYAPAPRAPEARMLAESRAARRWRPLPATARETDAIRAAFGRKRVRVLSGEAAREPAVREALAGPRYLHIATHGFADPAGDRLRAGLVLAPSPDSTPASDDDGVLELFEVHRLALTCDLAVLSACETAKGVRVPGEGAFALARGFLAAGSRRVVASLWAVDDATAARTVGALFTAIAGAERAGRAPDVALALRDAKRSVRREPRWADPFYWAPLVLSGR